VRPFFFGASKQPLFGNFHRAAAKPARRTGVILCNSFGVEAVYSHRMYRVLADRLSRIGYDVLRFDYFATGDSGGDCSEATLARWVDDVLTASDELLDTCDVRRMAWIGLRLGATTAALAAARGPAALSDLILWEPVVDGAAYLEELRRSHLKLLDEDLDLPVPHRFAAGNAGPAEVDEALGFAVPDTLRQEILGLEAGMLAGMRAGRVTVIASVVGEELDALQRAVGSRGGQMSAIVLGPSESWNSERAMNSSTIPTAALDAIIGCLEGVR
jgi:uncharacterized protein